MPGAGRPPSGPVPGAGGRPAPGRGGPPPAARAPAPAPPPEPVAAPKSFEIRKGRAATDGGADAVDAPLGPIVLPRSITQDAEAASLKERFGVERLPEVTQLHASVRVTESAGKHGPDRRRAGWAFLLLLLVTAAAAVFVAKQKGLL